MNKELALKIEAMVREVVGELLIRPKAGEIIMTSRAFHGAVYTKLRQKACMGSKEERGLLAQTSWLRGSRLRQDKTWTVFIELTAEEERNRLMGYEARESENDTLPPDIYLLRLRTLLTQLTELAAQNAALIERTDACLKGAREIAELMEK